MVLERLDFGVKVRKFMAISVKTCHSCVCNHPFLVGLVCFLILLYRSCPWLFSFLVTASPVLVCTAVLLGTLLSFGSPNIPEIDEHEEEKVSHEVSPLKTGVTEEDTVVKRDFTDDEFVERHVGKRWDIAENTDEKVSLVDNEVNEIEEGDGSVLYKPLVNDDLDSRDIHCENGVISEVEGLLNHSLLKKMTEIREELLESEGLSSMKRAEENQHLLAEEVGDINLELGEGKLTSDIDDVPRGDELDSSWKCVAGDDDAGGKDDDDGDDDESSDSGSDGAESSPDASLADISLMLDELHPLLGSEATQPAHLSRGGLDAASENSRGSSNDDSDESDELENEGEGDNDDEEGEGAKGDKEDKSKSAIKWTEDDQMNLMDLGTLELERNLRLDKLIARRRARNSMRLMAEKNLIDLDSADIPLNLAPISTSRGNPFDLPYDSYDDLGLPPIPGSAPSNLQHRRNPFDLPYDSSEEKPDLNGDSFQEEFSGFNQREAVSQRDAFFSRHESFNIGSSSLGAPRKEHKWKPYFVLEHLVTEGAIPSLFQRQSSDVSESKLSSVPDSDSVSSVADEEDNKPTEQDVSRETELILNEGRASVDDEQESHSSYDVESMDVDQVENRDVHHDVVEITLGDGESPLEIESMSEAGGTTHSEHNASETENLDVHRDAVVVTSEDGAQATSHVEFSATEIHPITEPAEEDYSSRSSLSSLSEIDEKISDVRGDEFAGFEPRDPELEESGISRQPSFEESEFHFTSEVVASNQYTEPIFDSSFHPPAVDTFLSFSTVSSDARAEISEMGSPSMLVVPTDKKLETAEQGTSSFQEMHDGFSDILNGNEPRARDLLEISGHDVTFAGLTGVSYTSTDHNVSMVPESVVGYVSRDAGSSSDEGLEEDVPNKEASSIQNQVDLLSLDAERTFAVDEEMGEVVDSSPEEQQYQMHPNGSSEAERVTRHVVEKEDTLFEQDELIQTECDQMHLSNFDLNLDTDGHHDKSDDLSSMALTYKHMPSVDVISSAAAESGHIVVAQVQQVHYSEANLREEHKKESELDQIQSPFSDSKTGTDLDCDMNVEGIPSNSIYEDMSYRENPSSESKKQMSFHEDELPVVEHDKLEEPSIIATESRRELYIVDTDINVHEVHDSEDKLSANFSSTTSESTSLPSESLGHTLPTDQEDLKEKILKEIGSEGPNEHFSYAEVSAPQFDEESNHEEDDELKEIDEGILYELDTVGDFNVEGICLPVGSNVAYTESAMFPEDRKTDINVDMPVLEARSVQDIDLDFKQLHGGVDVEEVILPSMVENLLDHEDTNSDLPVVEARSLEDIPNALQQGPDHNPARLPHSTDLRNESSEVKQHNVVSSKETEDSNAVYGIPKSCDNAAAEPENDEEIEELEMDTNVELPVLEVRSVEDIDLTFKQLHGGVDVEEVILPSMIENQPDLTDTTIELPVVVARSLEDIHNTFQNGPEPNPAELPHSTNLTNGLSEEEQHDAVSTKEIEVGKAVSDFQAIHENAATEPKNEYEEIEVIETGTNVELPVLEVRSVEDIDSSFKQLHEGVDVDEVILTSMLENQPDHADTISKLPVAEARSLEDIHNAFQKGPELSSAELALPTDLRNESSEMEQHDVVSDEEIDASHAISGIQEIQNAASEPQHVYEKTEEMKTETSVELPVLEARSVEDIDLAFKQLHEGVDVDEVILRSMIENQQGHADTNSDLPVVEARSLEDIHNAFQQGPESNLPELLLSSGEEHRDVVSSKEIDSTSNAISGIQVMSENAAGEPKHEYEETEEREMETKVALPILEARSVEDIDLAFKQLHEGVDAEEVILPSMIENQQGLADTNSDLPVVEARSLEDIDNAFQQGPESNLVELLHSSGEEHDDVVSSKEIDGTSNVVSGIQVMNENAAGEPKNEYEETEEVETAAKVALPVLEAKSVEDLDLAFKQLHEGVDVEEVILPSMIKNQEVHADTNSALPVVEARSLEDIHNAFQQGPESKTAELPHSSDLRIGSSEVERHDEISTKEHEVSNVVSGAQEHTENADDEPRQEHEESSEKSKLKLKGKKEKSHDSSSSSSSSSSDSE